MKVGDKDYPYLGHEDEVWLTRGGYKLVRGRSLFGQARWSLLDRGGVTLAVQTELFPKDPLYSGPPLHWAESFL